MSNFAGKLDTWTLVAHGLTHNPNDPPPAEGIGVAMPGAVGDTISSPTAPASAVPMKEGEVAKPEASSVSLESNPDSNLGQASVVGLESSDNSIVIQPSHAQKADIAVVPTASSSSSSSSACASVSNQGQCLGWCLFFLLFFYSSLMIPGKKDDDSGGGGQRRDERREDGEEEEEEEIEQGKKDRRTKKGPTDDVTNGDGSDDNNDNHQSEATATTCMKESDCIYPLSSYSYPPLFPLHYPSLDCCNQREGHEGRRKIEPVVVSSCESTSSNSIAKPLSKLLYSKSFENYSNFQCVNSTCCYDSYSSSPPQTTSYSHGCCYYNHSPSQTYLPNVLHLCSLTSSSSSSSLNSREMTYIHLERGNNGA